MADISKLNINGVEYDIKDEDARSGVSGIVNVSANDGTPTDTLRTIEIGGGVYSVKNSGFVSNSSSGLSSYWQKLATFTTLGVYNDNDITLWIHSAYNGVHGLVTTKVRWEGTGSNYFTVRLYQICGTLTNTRFRLYYDQTESSSTFGQCELWAQTYGQYSVYNCIVISESGRASVERSNNIVFNTDVQTEAQTPTLTNYVEMENSSIVNNAATATTATTAETADNATSLGGYAASRYLHYIPNENAIEDTAGELIMPLNDYTDSLGLPYQWGTVLQWGNRPDLSPSNTTNGNWLFQIYGSADRSKGLLHARGRTNGGSWSDWRYIVTSDTNHNLETALSGYLSLSDGGICSGDVSLAADTVIKASAETSTNYGFSTDGYVPRIESFANRLEYRSYLGTSSINTAYNFSFTQGGTDSSPNTITFPNKSGTVALTSDITSSSSGGLTEDEVDELIDNALSSYVESARVRCTKIQNCQEDTYIYDQLNLLRKYFGLLGDEMYIQTITIISPEFYINCIGNYGVDGNGEFFSATLSCIYNGEVLTGETVTEILGNYHQGEVDLLVYWNPVSTVNAIIDGN